LLDRSNPTLEIDFEALNGGSLPGAVSSADGAVLQDIAQSRPHTCQLGSGIHVFWPQVAIIVEADLVS